jgi:peptidoglycan/xylan/chitin deacetylase (PgdA/CDA1 family)
MFNQSEKKKIPILMYHSISHSAQQKFKQFCVSPLLFAEHMGYLWQHGFTTLTVTQFIQMRVQGKDRLPARPVILTFDDGYADFFTEALPVLQRFGFVATLYVATAFINGTSGWMQHQGEGARLMLTWDQIIEISKCGMEIGAHSHRHHQLDILPLAVARDEVVQCKEMLEDRLGQEVLSFSYPYGYHSATTQCLVRDAGYTSACAVKYEMNTQTPDPFSLARLMASADTSVEALAALLAQPSPLAITTMYKGARIPVWRLVRRFSNLRGSIYKQSGSAASTISLR